MLIQMQHPTTRGEPIGVGQRSYNVDAEGKVVVSEEHAKWMESGGQWFRVGTVEEGGNGGAPSLRFSKTRKEIMAVVGQLGLTATDLRSLADEMDAKAQEPQIVHQPEQVPSMIPPQEGEKPDVVFAAGVPDPEPELEESKPVVTEDLEAKPKEGNEVEVNEDMSITQLRDIADRIGIEFDRRIGRRGLVAKILDSQQSQE